MTVRNLTGRDYRSSRSSSFDNNTGNPFLASEEENDDDRSSSSFIHYDRDASRQAALEGLDGQRHVSDYKGYYSKNNTAQNLNTGNGNTPNLDNSKRYFHRRL